MGSLSRCFRDTEHDRTQRAHRIERKLSFFSALLILCVLLQIGYLESDAPSMARSETSNRPTSRQGDNDAGAGESTTSDGGSAQSVGHNNNTKDPTLCPGKQRVVAILQSADLPVDYHTCPELPKDEDIFALYGDKPILYGLEFCEAFRKRLSVNANNGTAIDPVVRVAGLYNSGTNALQWVVRENLPGKWMENIEKYWVPWHKHFPVGHWKGEIPKELLPVVLVRDPYRWFRSMVSQMRNLSIRKERSLPIRLLTNGFTRSTPSKVQSTIRGALGEIVSQTSGMPESGTNHTT